MNNDCEIHRKRIPELLLGEVSPEAAREVEEHIRQCPACTLEREAVTATFGRMKLLADVTPPRHFLVYPDERRANPWQAFLSLAPSWRVLAAAAMLLAVVGMGMFASRLSLRVGEGSLTISFGRAPAPEPVRLAPAPAPDTAALEARILQMVEEKNRKEAAEWVKAVRAEVSRAQSRLTRAQGETLLNALAAVEVRLHGRLDETARAIEERNDRNVGALYETVSLERQRDAAATDAKLSRLALAVDSRGNQTDAILDTLLQVAELRTR